MLDRNELQAIAQLLQRVDLKGNEAITVANLQVKIGSLLQTAEVGTPPEAATDNAPKPTPSSEAKNEDKAKK